MILFESSVDLISTTMMSTIYFGLGIDLMMKFPPTGFSIVSERFARFVNLMRLLIRSPRGRRSPGPRRERQGRSESHRCDCQQCNLRTAWKRLGS